MKRCPLPAPEWRHLSPDRLFRRDPEAGQRVVVSYNGHRVAVTVMDATAGWYKPGFSFADALCRAEDGRYFLVREVGNDRLNDPAGPPRFCLPADQYWLRVRRLSFACAARWLLRGCDKAARSEILRFLPTGVAAGKREAMNRPLGRIVVELDDVASFHLRENLAGKGFMGSKKNDPRDVASAAVVFLLDDPDKSDWCSSADVLAEAKRRRLHREGKVVQ